MDRKSFFKNILLGIGAAIVPHAVLKAIPVKDNTYPVEGLVTLWVEVFYFSGYDEKGEPTYTKEIPEWYSNQIQPYEEKLRELKTVTAKEYYFREYESNPIYDKLKESMNDELHQIAYKPTIRTMPKDARPYHLINDPNVLFDQLVKKFKMRQKGQRNVLY
jgi:hypothetical protein